MMSIHFAADRSRILDARHEIRRHTIPFRTCTYHQRDRYVSAHYFDPSSSHRRFMYPVDDIAHLVIPHHPALRPHSRMLHHFRFILPLLPRDGDGLTALHYYDSAIQLARHASRECTEAEFTIGLASADEIKKVYVDEWFCGVTRMQCANVKQKNRLNECRAEMLEGSLSDHSDAS